MSATRSFDCKLPLKISIREIFLGESNLISNFYRKGDLVDAVDILYLFSRLYSLRFKCRKL